MTVSKVSAGVQIVVAKSFKTNILV